MLQNLCAMERHFISTVFTKDENTCSGCTACASVCSQHAILMCEDSEGFFYPILDESKCVRCGLCDSICPMVNGHMQNSQGQQHCYLLTTRQRRFFEQSATIGACTMLADDFILDGASVFGASLDEAEWIVKHVKASDSMMIRNSKYAQSVLGTTFADIKAELVENHSVLFFGTPCQVAGLKAFLRKEYANLYTVDIFCHGVYSNKLLQCEVAYWEDVYNSKITNLKFRSKRKFPWIKGGVVSFDVVDGKGRRKHVEHHGRLSPTYRCYAYSGDGLNYNLRKSCYSCPFKEPMRYGDMSIGDAWFVNRYYPQVFTKTNRYNGISLGISNSKKGESLLAVIKKYAEVEEIEWGSAFVQPALLPQLRSIPPERQTIYQSAEAGRDYVQTIEHVLNVDFKQERSLHLKQFMMNKIRSLIKFIIHISH